MPAPEDELTLAERVDGLEARVRRVEHGVRARMIATVLLIVVACFFVWRQANQAGQQRAADRIAEETAIVGDLQAGCDRGNARLLPVWDFFNSAVHKLETVDLPSAKGDPTATARVTASISEFQTDADAMVAAVADVAKAPGSPEIDCASAFPNPTQ